MTLLAALRRRPRPGRPDVGRLPPPWRCDECGGLHRIATCVDVPPPSVPDLQPPPVFVNVGGPALTEAQVANLRQRLAEAMRHGLPTSCQPGPAEPLGYAVALLGADGRCQGTTHTTALDRDEAVREATACNRSQGTTGRYVAVEIRHLEERP